MSSNWVKDIKDMQEKFGVDEWMNNPANRLLLRDFLKFRLEFLIEELGETLEASANDDPEELVDGHIDICVIAIGTLLAFGVDAEKAWDVVHKANMAKERGIKEGREQSDGWDLIKPKDWRGPKHGDNTGFISDIFATRTVSKM